jgi:hypothetical protein
MDGTYIREPDGARLLRYSPHYWNDPATALRESGAAFTLVTGDHAEDFDVQNEAKYLSPGEWLRVDLDGALLEIGGAIGPMRAGL